jgi:cytochrome oxidase Cu insertion factor (SCO1/SenC/PrrC family)
MIQIRNTLLAGLMIVMILAACAPKAGNTDDMMGETPAMASTHTPDAVTEATHGDTMMDTTPDDTMMNATSEESSGMMETPAWFNVDLTNAATGESFKVADLSGKVVLVETMAQWCTNCMQQQRQVKELHNQLGMRDDLVTLGIDIDPNEDLATLKTYIERNEFDWLYTVAPAEVSNDLASLYGNQYLNPPSTPMLIIDRKGEVHLLPFGIKSADDLQKALEPFLSEGM